jgi:hypothetical protein
LPPAEVTIISEVIDGPHRRVIGYDWDPKVNTGSRQQRDPLARFLPVDEVAHWMQTPDPLANFRGMTWMTPIIRELAADSGMTAYKNQYLDHGTPVVAVKYPAKLRPETIDAAIERLQAKYGGVGNAFRPLVMDQGADPVLGNGLKDLDYAVVQYAGVERICSAGGVNPLLIGVSGARQPGVAYQEAMRNFADITGRVLWMGGCASLEKFVPNLPPRGVELWFDTADVAALQAAETERAQVIQVEMAAVLTGVQAGYTRDSVVSSVAAGDVSQLQADPNAPPPGQGPGQRTGTPPGGGQVLTQAQTPASKTPQPDTLPTTPVVYGSAKNPSMNGNGRG